MYESSSGQISIFPLKLVQRKLNQIFKSATKKKTALVCKIQAKNTLVPSEVAKRRIILILVLFFLIWNYDKTHLNTHTHTFRRKVKKGRSKIYLNYEWKFSKNKKNA